MMHIIAPFYRISCKDKNINIDENISNPLVKISEKIYGSY